MRAVILKGDTTSHGGTVLEGDGAALWDGRAVAGVGHKVECPKCKGTFPILPDLLVRRYSHQIHGRDTAVEGMRTACGATLIASQHSLTVDDTGDASAESGAGLGASAASVMSSLLPESPTLCLECLKAAAQSGAAIVMRD